MREIHNPNCDGSHCTSERGEVRRLPHTANPNHGASILCKACYAHEMRFRKDRNRDLSAEAQYPFPAWESLELYKEATE